MRRNRKGSNAVEFALSMPILAILLLGVMDYGWMFTRTQAVVAAAREGARAAALDSGNTGDPEGACSARGVSALTDLGYNASDITVTPTLNAGTGTETDPRRLTCTVTFAYEPLIGFVPGPSQLQAALTVRLKPSS